MADLGQVEIVGTIAGTDYILIVIGGECKRIAATSILTENGYQGIAALTTNPTTPSRGDWYFANENGTYTYFGNQYATKNDRFYWNGTSWDHLGFTNLIEEGWKGVVSPTSPAIADPENSWFVRCGSNGVYVNFSNKTCNANDLLIYNSALLEWEVSPGNASMYVFAQDVDAAGFGIKNVKTAVDPGDVVPKSQAESIATQAANDLDLSEYAKKGIVISFLGSNPATYANEVLTVSGQTQFYMPKGGLYYLNAGSYTFPASKTAYLSRSSSSFLALDEDLASGTSVRVYLYLTDLNDIAFDRTRKGVIPLASVNPSGVISVNVRGFKIKIGQADISNHLIGKPQLINEASDPYPTRGILVGYNGNITFEDNILTWSTYIVVYMPNGGYYQIAPSSLYVESQSVVFISASSSSLVPIDENQTLLGRTAYLRAETHNSVLRNTEGYILLGMAYGAVWNANFPALSINALMNTDVDRWVEIDKKRLLPPLNTNKSPIISNINTFVEKYRKRRADVTVVHVGDSISTNTYASTRSDAAYRPPLMTNFYTPSRIEEKLRWRGQQYRRFDSKTIEGGDTDVFIDILGGGAITEVKDDPKWGSVNATDFYYMLTRLITGGTNAGTSFIYPSGMKRCNFIYHSDADFATSTLITIAEGDNLVEVWNGTAWVEANGFTFSAKEDGILHTYLSYTYYEDSYQKRLKMRSLTNLTAKTVTITNVGTGRFGYWGIEYSPKEFMFTYINAAKGGHDIARLRTFEQWMVDDFNPDLIIHQCPIINEGCKSVAPTVSPIDFATTFANYYDALIAKGYDVFEYVAWIGSQAEIVDETTGEWNSSEFAGYGQLTVFDYIGHLTAMFETKNAAYASAFRIYTELAQRKAELESTTIFTAALEASLNTGETFLKDGVHMNDYGEEILWRMIENYFNF